MAKSESNSAIRSKILNYNNNHIQEFLILLRSEDYKKTWFSNSVESYLLQKKNELFPGILHIIELDSIIDEHTSKKYPVQGICKPKTIYIKLPKENMYVSSDIFLSKYMLSKQNELLNIFIKLGAKKITLTVENQDEQNNKIFGEISGYIQNLNIGIGVRTNLDKYTNEKNLSSSIMTFPNINNIDELNLDYFYSSSNFFYLKDEYEWNNIIKRRLCYHMISDNYTYNHSSDYKFDINVKNKLKILNIDFGYDSSKYESVKIIYDVEYYENNTIDIVNSINPIGPINPDEHPNNENIILNQNNNIKIKKIILFAILLFIPLVIYYFYKLI